jgi:hypothetical protein
MTIWKRALPATVLTVLLLLTPARANAQDNPCGAVDCTAVIAYERTLPAETLIRITWAGTPDVDRMLRIAMRESHMNCGADNPHSSAAGLLQTMGIHRARAERMGLSWANVAGPDCLDDVLLAKALYDDSGLRPWAL